MQLLVQVGGSEAEAGSSLFAQAFFASHGFQLISADSGLPALPKLTSSLSSLGWPRACAVTAEPPPEAQAEPATDFTGCHSCVVSGESLTPFNPTSFIKPYDHVLNGFLFHIQIATQIAIQIHITK